MGPATSFTSAVREKSIIICVLRLLPHKYQSCQSHYPQNGNTMKHTFPLWRHLTIPTLTQKKNHISLWINTALPFQASIQAAHLISKSQGSSHFLLLKPPFCWFEFQLSTRERPMQAKEPQQPWILLQTDLSLQRDAHLRKAPQTKLTLFVTIGQRFVMNTSLRVR